MAKITKIEKQKKRDDKYNIFLDNEFYCGLYIDVCVRHGLKEGKEIEKETLDEYVLESEKTIALNKTAKYMQSALKTTKQIRDYLYKKGYEKVTIDYVVEKLKEYNYLDDQAYADAYLKTFKSKYGEYKLKEKLRLKGVGENIIDDSLKQIDNDDEIIYNLAIKYMKKKEPTSENFVKLSRFLSMRGFSYDDIKSVLNKLKKGGFEDASWD